MKAEQTVMGHQECQKAKLPVTPPFTDDERIAKAQAEISFKAGKDECVKTHFKPDWEIGAQHIKEACEEGRVAGIREVLEIGDKLVTGFRVDAHIFLQRLKEQALKERG